MTTTVMLSNILAEFQAKVDTTKAYELKELKQILEDIYKEKKTGKSVKKDAEVAATKKEKPAKRAPSSYNKFMSERIKALKQENMETNARDLMKMASLEWKVLSQEQKDAYK